MNRGLAHWAAINGTVPGLRDSAFAELSSQPRYEDACRLAAQVALDRYESRSPMARLIKDMAGMFLGVFALYLDARGGLTVTSLQEFGDDVGVSSRGRAAAFLLQMRISGYVRRDTEANDKRVRRYVPTDLLLETMRAMFRSELTALALIEPEALQVAEHLSEPSTLKSYVLVLGEAMANVVKANNRTLLNIFADRDKGMHILYYLALHGEKGDSYPPRGSVPVTTVELTKRFGVSRSHVRRLFQDAQKQGLFLHIDEGECVFSPLLREALLRFHAGIFLGSAACAAAALEAITCGDKPASGR